MHKNCLKTDHHCYVLTCSVESPRNCLIYNLKLILKAKLTILTDSVCLTTVIQVYMVSWIFSYYVQSGSIITFLFFTGFVAWRDAKEGSWFIQDFVNTMREWASKEHLSDIMIRVKRSVAKRFGEENGKLTTQMPEPIDRLRKKLYFRPGK